MKLPSSKNISFINILKKNLNIISNPNDTIQDVKSQLLQWILIVINILGIPIVIIGFIEALLLNQHLTAYSYLICYAPILLALILRTKISFKICASMVLISLYLTGVFNLIFYGFSGASIPIFFALLVFTTVFFEIKAGLKAVMLCLLPMIIIGLLFIQNKLSLDISLQEINTYPISWFTASAIFVFLGILIIISFGMVQKKMIHSLQFSNQKTEELGKLNLQLTEDIINRKKIENELRDFHDKLEDLVEKRTVELEEKNKKLEKIQQSIILLLKDVNKSREELDHSNKELKEQTKVLEKSRKSLALLLEDVNESRTELNLSNKKLNASNKELEAFSYSVSHDLRAPLRHIDGFAKLLYKNMKQKIDEKSQNYFDNIISSSKQMNQLIDDLLIFSRMGRKDVKKNKINMKTVVEEVIQIFDSDIKENNIFITVDDMPEVNLDAALIRQAWVNLISNAIKFTTNKENPEIHIGAEKDTSGNTVFFIKDNGVGFNQKYVDKIFGVFQRLHNINEFPGTGIGLANVKRIILKHGGEIRAEGKVNKGASFFFKLPDA